MKKFIWVLLFFGFKAFSAETCLEISEPEMQQWKERKPKAPALAHLIKARKLIESEKEFSLSLGNDKTAHCYLGCRIHEDINMETVLFTAWKKEYDDATDCDSNTYFDVEDYSATIDGTFAPQNQCAVYCQNKPDIH